MKETIKNRNKKIIKLFRMAVQIICFIFSPSLFISIYQSMNNIFTGIFNHSGTFTSLMPDIILLLLVTAVTAFSGRFFCGWVCAFGSMGDFIYGIHRKVLKKNTVVPKILDTIFKFMKYILLFGTIVFVWGLQIITIPAGVSPWDLFGMMMSFGNWPSVSVLAQGWTPAVILLFGIIVCSFIVERFFCRYLCPLGAYFSIISRIRPLLIVKHREECGTCSLCTKKCSMRINLNAVDKVHSGECINCMECVSNCPKSNTHLEISDINVNGAVAGTASCTLVVGAVYLGTFYSNQINLSYEGLTTISADGTQSNAANGDWKDGTYVGTGTGFRGETTVEVTVFCGCITDIQIVSTSDDTTYIDKASNQVILDIISTQSEDVDTVSGATYSSNGIIEAVKDALSETVLESVSIDSAELETETQTETIDATQENAKEDFTESNTLDGVEDGTYEGNGTGFRGDTTVSVTVSGGVITAITVLSYQDDRQYFERASDTVIEEIITNQDVNVDAVSGATYSSNGIMGAVADALNLDYTQPVITGGKRGH